MHQATSIKQIIARTRERIRSGTAAEKYLVEMQHIGASVDALAAVASNRDPTTTEAAHVEKVHASAKKLAAALDKHRTRANDLLNGLSQHLRAQIDNRTGILPPNDAAAQLLASEIRSVARSLPIQDRQKLLTDAMEKRDHTTLSALLTAPESLSGLPASYTTDMRRAHEAAVAPELVKELEEVFEADEVLSVVIATAADVAKELQSAKKVDEISLQRKLAVDASINFLRALDTDHARLTE